LGSPPLFFFYIIFWGFGFFFVFLNFCPGGGYSSRGVVGGGGGGGGEGTDHGAIYNFELKIYVIQNQISVKCNTPPFATAFAYARTYLHVPRLTH